MTRRCSVLAILLALAMAVSAFAAEVSVQYPVFNRAPSITVPSTPHRAGGTLDETIYYEDWEDGDFAGWVGIDLTAQPATWHVNDWNAFGSTGLSFWVGDSTINGYRDDWYMALDSPPITLPAGTPTLRFYHRYRCEAPGGEPAGYNGWDGMNLRISTNNGSTWTVVPSTALTPAYDRTSLYSFGFQHGEGTGVPGWCGLTVGQNWHIQTANLATWAGQTVKLRWAFASDPAYSTPDDPTMFGWQVDAIRVYANTDTVFSHDGDNMTGWTGTNVRPTGGNLWRVATDNLSPAGAHIIVCNDAADNLYNADMNTVFESPLIDVTEYVGGSLIADVQITGSVACTQETFPDCDYWGMEISIDSGFSWCAVSNPTCDPDGQNFVYIDMPEFWASFNESYSDDMDFSALLGNVLKFRFTFESNGDTQYDVGPKFDGFELEYSPGFPNDISCYTLQVRYPNQVGRPNRIRAYFKNTGSNAQNNVNAFYRRSGVNNWFPFIPISSLAPNEEARRDTGVTITTAGVYTFWARAALASDENMQNDTSVVENVDVQASSPNLEIGYDNRTFQYRFNYVTGAGPLVHFTPLADGVTSSWFSMPTLRLQFDQQQGNFPIQLHIYRGDETGPNTADEIYDQEITVLQSETAPNWKIVDLSGDPDLSNLTEDVWVWLEVVDTNPDDRWPQILGDDAEPWDDIHFYTWNGSGNATASDYFYQIHAVVTGGVPVEEIPAELPAVWSLEQNYPNPFNPTTEIRFSVPKAEYVTLKVYNLMGQEVATLVNGVTQPGVYKANFTGAGLASGVYMYRLESASFSATQKMLLMK